MNFKNYLMRANLFSLQNFFKHGGECLIEIENKTYEQRLKDARKNAVAFFKMKFTDIKEFDDVLCYFEEQCSAYEEVYFEIGMILGAKMA